MKKINSYEELREFCLSQSVNSCYCNYATFDKHEGVYNIYFCKNEPKFMKNDYWSNGRMFDILKNVDADILFDCDFSKCCWEVK